MIVTLYREPAPEGGWKGVVQEVSHLIRNPDKSARQAGLDFAEALKTLRALRQMVDATPLPIYMRPSNYGSSETLWDRTAHKHSLYLSRISANSSFGGPEVRVLHAVPQIIPEGTRMQEAIARHQRLDRSGSTAP